MAVLSVADVRRRVQTRITAALGPQGWRVSRFVPDLFGKDTDQIAPRVFSVGVGSTSPIGDRQRLAAGTTVETALVVRFAWRLRADSQLDDFDAALDAEEDLLAAVMSTDLTDLHLRLDGIPPRVSAVEGNWYLGELLFRTEHRIPLT